MVDVPLPPIPEEEILLLPAKEPQRIEVVVEDVDDEAATRGS